MSRKKPSIVFKSHQQIIRSRQSIFHSDFGAREKKIIISGESVTFENNEVTQTRKGAIKSTFQTNAYSQIRIPNLF